MYDKTVFVTLCALYGSSEIPAALIGEGVFWENKKFRRFFRNMDEEKERFLADIKGRTGICYEKRKDTICKLNISGTEGLTLVEIIGEESIVSVMGNPAVLEYINYIVERLRGHTSDIMAVSNCIMNELSHGSPERIMEILEEKLGRIDISISDIISDIIEPEQFLFLMNGSGSESTVCLADDIIGIIKEMKASGIENIVFIPDEEAAIYARMSRSAFKVIVTDAIARMYSGRYEPDSITVSTYADGRGCAEVMIEADYSSKRISDGSSPAAARGYGGAFFDYLCDAFCDKYGGTVTLKAFGDKENFSLCFPALVSERVEVYAPDKYSSNDCFDVVKLRFGRGGKAE